MVITGQAGSGPKGQTDRKKYSPWEEKGKGRRMERWACRGLVQGLEKVGPL